MNFLSIGKSKLARRFALIFVGCAFIPTFLLFFLSYNRVSSELLEQSIERLSEDTRTYGWSLWDRIVRMSDQLMFLTQMYVEEQSDIRKVIANSSLETKEIFDSLVFLREDGLVVGLFGTPRLTDLSLIPKRYLDTSQAVSIFSVEREDGPSRQFMIYRLQTLEGETAFMIAEANWRYLWGLGEVLLLPAVTELAVYDQSGSALITTAASPGASINSFKKNTAGRNFRNFEFVHGGDIYLAWAWDLFLPSKFEASTWTIVLSQPKDYILSFLRGFQKNLVMAITLGLLIVLLLSMFFIRRRLEPLDVLKLRTEQIAAKDFTGEVVVDSGDEFEELADSFNIMSRELQKQFSAMETIDYIDRAILSSLSLPDIINSTLPMIRNFFHCDMIVMGSIIDKATCECAGYVLNDTMKSPVMENFSLDQRLRTLLFTDSAPYFWEKEQTWSEIIPSLKLQDYKVLLSVPLKKDEDAKGIVLLGHRQDRAYDESELKQLRQLADQMSIALSNTELVDNLEKLATGTIEALARTVDAKSKWTSGHSERVSEYAAQIGTSMGLGEKDIELLSRGGLLHDIGKIGTPVAILDKAAKLSDEEYREIQSHPEVGAKILEPVEAHQDILHMVLQHHERFDGKGYPQGLAGEEIHLHGRILAVADVYDALGSARPYRGPWDKQKVVDFIVEHSGSHFDPVVVSAFKIVMA